jgi:hypothetical protein
MCGNNYLRIYFFSILLAIAHTALAIPNKGLVLAVNLEGLIDCSNLIGGRDTQGAVHNCIENINHTVVARLNRRTQKYDNLSFTIEFPLHMTLTYIGYLDDKDPTYKSIIQDLKENITNAIKKWRNDRSDKGPLRCKIDTIIWPPIGTPHVWLAYSVQIAQESKEDFLKLLNGISSVLCDMNQEWFGAIRDVKNQQKVFIFYKSLDTFHGHVSLARFDRPYTLDQEAEPFGLPRGANKRRIDKLFKELPAPVKPDFEVKDISLFVKDIGTGSRGEIVQTFALIS